MRSGRAERERQYDLEERLIGFTMKVIEIVEALPQSRIGNHVAGQLVRCGTSPAPNYAEARSAESRRDFVHKLKLVLKELRETRIWLLLAQREGLVKPPERVIEIQVECEELISIFASSIRTTQKKEQHPPDTDSR